MAKSPFQSTSKTPLFIFLFFLSITTQSFSARTLSIARPPATHYRHHRHHDSTVQPSLSFLMQNVLLISEPSNSAAPNLPSNPYNTPPSPFWTPTGLFPSSSSVGSIPLSNQLPSTPGLSSSTDQQGLNDLRSIGLAFIPARATLEELELRTVTPFEMDLFEELDGDEDDQDQGSAVWSSWAPVVVGRGKGLYVVSSEDGSSHMMAMTAHFGGSNDSLRFFGVHRQDVAECHLAVVGGSGKFENANGYATIETMTRRLYVAHTMEATQEKMLLFNVFLS